MRMPAKRVVVHPTSGRELHGDDFEASQQGGGVRWESQEPGRIDSRASRVVGWLVVAAVHPRDRRSSGAGALHSLGRSQACGARLSTVLPRQIERLFPLLMSLVSRTPLVVGE